MSPNRIIPRGGPAYAISLTTVSAIGAVVYSHYAQVRDKNVMKAGVERDRQRLRQKRRMQHEGLSPTPTGDHAP